MVEVNFDKPKGNAPLSRVLRGVLATEEMARVRRFAGMFDAFHLKNTLTTGVNGRMTTINGREVINFASCNYLGLDQHPEVTAASIEGARRWGNHAGCSRIFTTQENLMRLEQELASLVGAERAMVGVNVSQIHQGAIPALFSEAGTMIFVDRFAHTSLYQAALIAKAKGAELVRVDIAKPRELAELLNRSADRKVLLVDGIYSMQGSIPDFPALQELCQSAGAVLYVDDAHGTGVLGEHGGGVAEEQKLSFDNLILVGSLQKGIGAHGGFIAGCGTLIDCLRTLSKTYIFSGPPQPQTVDCARAAVQITRSEEGSRLRATLKAHSTRVRKALIARGLDVPEGNSPIVPVRIGDELRTLMAGRKLFDLGVYVNSVLFPAVPKGEGILRVSITAAHTDEQIDALLEAFEGLDEFFAATESGLRRGALVVKEVLKSKIQGESYRGL